MFAAYRLLWLSGAFLLGIVAGELLFPFPRAAWGLGALALAAAALMSRRRRAGGVLLLLAAFAAGGARLAFAQPPLGAPDFIASYANSPRGATIVGKVIAPPDYRFSYANLTVAAEYLRFGHDEAIPIKGKVLAKIPPEQASRIHYGDRVVLTGRLKTPPAGGVFSYRAYLARKGIFVVVRASKVGVLSRGGPRLLCAIYSLRERAHAIALKIWPGASGALLSGILLGLDKGIPKSIYDAFRSTGTAHIIAISGFNITILAGLFTGLFGRLWGEMKGAALAVLAIAGYTVFVGADAAVVRAAIMGFIGMLALQTGRKQHAYTSLAFAAAFMALLNPYVLWDLGFQLSFAATLGLVRFGDVFERGARRALEHFFRPEVAQTLSRPLNEFFFLTLAAQLATFPISAYHFGQVSLIALLANPAILPVQAPLMVGGGVALLAGLLWLPAGRALGLLVWPLAEYTIHAVKLFASIPVTSASVVNLSLPVILAYYALLFGLPYFWEKRATLPLPSVAVSKSAVLLGLAALVAVVWKPAFAVSEHRLSVSILPVGNGEAVLIRTPSGQWVLLDGGENARALLAGLGEHFLPWADKVDWLVVGSTDEESVEALPDFLRIYRPRAVWWASRAANSPAARLAWSKIKEEKVPLHEVRAGAALNFGDGVRLEAIAVSARGAVFLLRWRRFRFLLPLGEGEGTDARLRRLAPSLRPLSAMLLAGSGYYPLNPPETVWALEPLVLVVSVRPADPRGRPSPELLQELRPFTLLRTDLCGEINIVTDGVRMWVSTAKKCSAYGQR